MSTKKHDVQNIKSNNISKKKTKKKQKNWRDREREKEKEKWKYNGALRRLSEMMKGLQYNNNNNNNNNNKCLPNIALA